MRKPLTLLLVITMILLTACSQQKRRYVIGVSQCSADIWREKQNAELRMAAYLQDNVDLRFAAAYDSDERQIQQIDSLLKTGIDLLIVAPNQVQTISPAIDRAYDSGIPVIVFERKTSSQKFTAFMSADNYEMGYQMGQYIATQLKGNGRVLEVKGLSGSSPAIERHKGFTDAIARYPAIHLVATLEGDWTEESAYKSLSQALSKGEGTQIDYVFGQNDRMAVGTRKAYIDYYRRSGIPSQGEGGERGRLPRFCGIDGLPGQGGGIQLVRDSVLDASFIYPTHGDQLLQTAIDILDGKAYDKETRLMSAIVTRDNAGVLLMQSDEIMRQTTWLDQLHDQADGYLRQLDSQRIITLLALSGVVLLLLALVMIYRFYLGRIRMQHERVVNTLWNMDTTVSPATDDTAEEASPLPPSPVEKQTDDTPAEQAIPTTAQLFIARFKEAVEARLEDSELSVEDLAADMHLSRVQLYRKVKTVTGSTPVELLRTARLKRGYQLLLTTDKSVSEVAYQVGFTAPSYFTKCFKEEYGQLPGDVRSS